MAFPNTNIAALLLSLSAAVSTATAYTTAPIPSPETSIPIDEQAEDTQYLKAHMTAAANQVELFLSNVVPKMSMGPANAVKQCRCGHVCSEVYDFALDDLKKGVESVVAGDFFTVNEDLTSFITNIETCDDCIVESKEAGEECSSEFGKFDGWAKGVGRDLLARSVKYSNIPT